MNLSDTDDGHDFWMMAEAADISAPARGQRGSHGTVLTAIDAVKAGAVIDRGDSSDLDDECKFPIIGVLAYGR